MIPLRIQARSTAKHPFLVRLNSEARAFQMDQEGKRTSFDADLIEASSDRLLYSGPEGSIELGGVAPAEVDGDVILVLPGGRPAHRLIRADSPHNTFLVTERCDQLCVMCSQPPKRHHADMFPFFEAAALLAPERMTIGISGGEPTLFKADLFAFMKRVLEERSDLSFHVLTNGQHITAEDMDALASMPRGRVLWGIPLYADDAVLHDRIVSKEGAFDRLMATFPILCRAGASIELRTVVMASNASALPRLARFVTTHLPFVSSWALMQLENIGYGRQNWNKLFLDTSVMFDPIGNALDIARSRGANVVMYNFPRCTVPMAYRHLAPSTISDWKRRYLAECEGCLEKDACGGFFEWYPTDQGFTRLGLQ
ncbi:MAG: His-Xaa-Ser system radical SAM maturase HxsC [Rhizobiales bacterium]|nr:His-Xaa-Ser system radical SAM maturase HxsC [Hyphomicrobiales bacterium]